MHYNMIQVPGIDGLTALELASARRVAGELHAARAALCGDLLTTPDAWRRYVSWNEHTQVRRDLALVPIQT